jgi:colanic acid biosynthesis protein WcaH
MSVAFKRLTLNELGVELNIDKAGFIGPFEHFYVDNVSGECLSTHYIALCYRLLVDDTLLNLPTEQHSQYKWISVDELLSDAEVHKHSRWYFDPSAS